MDPMTVAAFVAFLVLVIAWLAAPNDARRLVATVEPSAVGAD